jgi:hypothetical protein
MTDVTAVGYFFSSVSKIFFIIFCPVKITDFDE